MELRSLEYREDEAKDEKSIGGHLLKCMNYTTAHGIGRLAQSKTIAWKIFWIVVCLGNFSMFVYQIHGLFLLYLSRPVSTSIKITFEKEIPLPAVTICNLNMIRSDSIPRAVKKVLKNQLQYETSSTSQKRSRRFTATNDSSTDENNYGNDDYENNYANDDYPDVGKVNDRTKAKKEVLRLIIANLKFGHMYPHGHLFSKLFVQCTWKELDCKSKKVWKRSWNNNYGNCYTFNSGSDNDDKPFRILKSTKPGPSNGLFLQLNIEQDKYIGPLTTEAGARVVLHVQGSVPFPEEEGFSVAPGMATSVGLKKTRILRLDRFGNQSCLINDELAEQNIYRKFKNVTHYSQQVCLYSCLGLSQLSRCNCSDIAYPTGGEPCKPFNSKTRRCLKRVHLLYMHDRLKCLHECRKPCKEEVIQKTISLSQWPSKAYQRYLVSMKKPAANVSDSTLLLKIFYNELNYEKIEEEFSYMGVNLLADIGGQLGLWIGISAITCCEVLELLIKVFSRLLRKCKTASRP